MTNPVSNTAGDASRPWEALSTGFEQARAREDSLDRLVEWPAERALIGDVTGLTVLDAGCGNGSKVTQLVREGAAAGVGVDIAGNFVDQTPGVDLVRADLSDLTLVPEVARHRFDRVMFLQSFGYAQDPVVALRAARELLTDDGFIIVTRTQPIRYALQRAEENGTTVGEEYFSTERFAYRHGNWDDSVTLTKRPYTMSDLLNSFSAAGLWLERTVEPWMSPEVAARFSEKYHAANKHMVGILMFKLRPLAQQP